MVLMVVLYHESEFPDLEKYILHRLWEIDGITTDW